MRALGCLGLLAVALVWLILSYYPVGFLLLGLMEADHAGRHTGLPLTFAWYIITPALFAYAAFRLIRPIK